MPHAYFAAIDADAADIICCCWCLLLPLLRYAMAMLILLLMLILRALHCFSLRILRCLLPLMLWCRLLMLPLWYYAAAAAASPCCHYFAADDAAIAITPPPSFLQDYDQPRLFAITIASLRRPLRHAAAKQPLRSPATITSLRHFISPPPIAGLPRRDVDREARLMPCWCWY